MKNFAENNILKKMADAKKKKFFGWQIFSYHNEFFIYVYLAQGVPEELCVF